MAYNYNRKGHHPRKWDDLKLIIPMLIIGGGIAVWVFYMCLGK